METFPSRLAPKGRHSRAAICCFPELTSRTSSFGSIRIRSYAHPRSCQRHRTVNAGATVRSPFAIATRPCVTPKLMLDLATADYGLVALVTNFPGSRPFHSPPSAQPYVRSWTIQRYTPSGAYGHARRILQSTTAMWIDPVPRMRRDEPKKHDL